MDGDNKFVILTCDILNAVLIITRGEYSYYKISLLINSKIIPSHVTNVSLYCQSFMVMLMCYTGRNVVAAALAFPKQRKHFNYNN